MRWVERDSATVRARVVSARQLQARRYAGCGWSVNAAAPGPALAARWPLPASAQRLVDEALATGSLTRRGATRVHRLAWTVADRDGVARPGVREVATALVLRSTDASRSLPGHVVRSVS